MERRSGRDTSHLDRTHTSVLLQTRKPTNREIAAKQPTINGYSGLEQYNLRKIFEKDAWRS